MALWCAGPCPSCQALVSRYQPSALLWGDLAVDLLPIGPADLFLL